MASKREALLGSLIRTIHSNGIFKSVGSQIILKINDGAKD